MIVRPYGQRGSIGDPELAIDAVQVDLHGAFGEFKPLRYFNRIPPIGCGPGSPQFPANREIYREIRIFWPLTGALGSEKALCRRRF